MKRSANLYSEVCDLENIISMTEKVCKTVRNKKKVNIFETYKVEHIYNIKKRLDDRNLNVGKYNIFMITDPKCRIVMAQEIEDKIINHLIANYVLVKVFENKYTDFMCATRIGKGTTYGIRLLKKYVNKYKKKYDNFYVLKIDIHKYFYMVDHNILKKILNEKIKDKDSLNILNSIIDSTNEPYVNDMINRLKRNRIYSLEGMNIRNKNKLIKEVCEIPSYEYGKGLALGNQTSQAFGLIYLYKLVHFIKEQLHIKCLISYMDDMVILHNDKDYLKYCLSIIKDKLKNEYALELNSKKSKIDSVKNGIDFLGYKFYLKKGKLILKVRKNTKKRFKKKIKNINLLFDNNLIDRNELRNHLSSYKGIMKWGNCNNLYYKVMGDVKC